MIRLENQNTYMLKLLLGIKLNQLKQPIDLFFSYFESVGKKVLFYT